MEPVRYCHKERTDFISDEHVGCLFLWEEVVRKAVEDALLVNQSITSINHKKALAFIFREDCDAFNSFNNICRMLNIDPGKAKAHVKKKYEKLQAKHKYSIGNRGRLQRN